MSGFDNGAGSVLSPLFGLVQIVGWLAFAASLGTVLLNLGVGMAYGGAGPGIVAVMAVSVAVLAVSGWLPGRRAARGPLGGPAPVLAGALGLPLAMLALYGGNRDPGDWLLYAGPAALGGCLVLLALEPVLCRRIAR